jgi:hypothetical protein
MSSHVKVVVDVERDLRPADRDGSTRSDDVA